MTQPISSFTASTQIPPAATRTADSPGEATQESEAVRKWKASGLKLLDYMQKLGKELEPLKTRHDQIRQELNSVGRDIVHAQTALKNYDIEETNLQLSSKLEESKNITITYKKTLSDLCYEVAIQRACLNKHPYKLVTIEKELGQKRTMEINGVTYTVTDSQQIGYSINDQTFVQRDFVREVPGALPYLKAYDLRDAQLKCESREVKAIEEQAKELECFSPLPIDADLSAREADWATLHPYTSKGVRNFSLQLVDGSKLYEVETQIRVDFWNEFSNLISKLNEKIAILAKRTDQAFDNNQKTAAEALDVAKKVQALMEKREVLRSQLQDKQRVYSALNNEQQELGNQIQTLSSEYLEIIQMSRLALQALKAKKLAEMAQAQQKQ